MIGESVAHYRVLEKIGAGGMGVVYKAEDTKLHRTVALKFLPDDLAGDAHARERFLREARAASALNHPNICTIYEVNEHGGKPFIAMEYLEGATLRERIQQRSLTCEEALRIGAQIADALEAAHARGIVHRDVKPGNVFVGPQGQVKVLDFGLAKTIRSESGEDFTASLAETRAIAGTPAYMAPEQLRGDPVDPRADLYAMGVTLYEMVAGKPPFQAELITRLTDDILHREPRAPRAINAECPPELERIILKCLSKNPDDRLATARELAAELRRVHAPPVADRAASNARWYWAVAGVLAAGLVLWQAVIGIHSRWLGGRESPRIESIAVLPLENMSRDPQQEYFADGMTEALIAELSKIRALKVISRTSVMQYKGVKKPLPEIARELKVDGVVEGSVLREGDEVRITVQLIRADSDSHLWAESYTRELRNVLALQGEVARAIAREIRVAVTPEEESRLARTGAVDPEAHALVLQGNHLINQENTSREALERCGELFQQALTKDPAYAPAFVGLSNAQISLAGVGYRPMLTAAPLAKAAAERAIELDPNLGEAYAARALARYHGEWDWAGAEQDFRRAEELSPGSAFVANQYAMFLAAMGRLEEALAYSKRGVDLDPLNPAARVYRAQFLFYARRYEEAAEECRQLLTLKPGDVFGQWMLAVILSEQKKYDEAIALFLGRKVASPETNWSLGYTYGRAGRRKDAQRVIDFLLKREQERYVWPGIIAITYIGIGDNEKAFLWLEKSYRERDWWLLWLLGDPRFDPVRNDPRFHDLVKRMKFPPRAK
jgi:TolB-like protein/tRNA A-37 threonylcarbamoyl transferase component Bud32/predicted Zn-dependent protease